MSDELKWYQMEVEMRVSRTFVIVALDPDQAQQLVFSFIELARDSPGMLSSVLKWTDGRHAYRPMPVEQILENRVIIRTPQEIKPPSD